MNEVSYKYELSESDIVYIIKDYIQKRTGDKVIDVRNIYSSITITCTTNKLSTDPELDPKTDLDPDAKRVLDEVKDDDDDDDDDDI